MNPQMENFILFKVGFWDNKAIPPLELEIQIDKTVEELKCISLETFRKYYAIKEAQKKDDPKFIIIDKD